MKTFQKLLLGLAVSMLFVAQIPITALAAIGPQAANAVQYIADHQATDGSFAPPLSTDQAVVALAAAGNDPSAVNSAGNSAVSYLQNNPLADDAVVGAIERRILAIAAANQNPTNFAGVDYIRRLTAQANNNQIGDLQYINDDIFGIMAAATTDDTALRADAQQALNYLVASQRPNGGFSSFGTTIDCVTDPTIWQCVPDSNNTAAAIVAMRAAAGIGLTNTNLATAENNAIDYLLGLQQQDGGFLFDTSIWSTASDGPSTAWVLIALNSLGTCDARLAGSATKAHDWLAAHAEADGHYTAFSDYTADAVLALTGTTWLLSKTDDSCNIILPKAKPADRPAPVTVISDAPTTPAPASPTPTISAPQTETLAAETTTTPQPEQTPQDTPVTDDQKDQTPQTDKTGSRTPKYVLYIAIALALIGFGWYLFQPKKS